MNVKSSFRKPILHRTSTRILEMAESLPALTSPKALNVDPRPIFRRTKSLKKVSKIPGNPQPKLKCKQITKGTMSIILQNEPGTSVNRRYLLRKGLKNSTRNKLKVKTIQWLIANHKKEVDKLLDNCKLMMQTANYKGSINIQQFHDIMSSLGIGIDQTLIDRLFWVFDEDGNGYIEAREVMVGLEMFRSSSFQEKLEVFFDICDEDGSGDIDEDEFYNVLKLCVPSSHVRELLKESLHDLFMAIDEDGNGVLSKEELIRAANQSEAVRTIIEKSISNAHYGDLWFSNDFYQPHIQKYSGLTAGRTNGVFHPEIDRLVSVLKDEEEIYEQGKQRKFHNKMLLKKWIKENDLKELSSDDEEKEIIYSNEGEIIN